MALPRPGPCRGSVRTSALLAGWVCYLTFTAAQARLTAAYSGDEAP